MDADFINLLGLRLLHGRLPEVYEPGVALVNQALARGLWGRDDVVGELMRGNRAWNQDSVEIIGVLEDLSFGHRSAPVNARVFMPAGNLTAVVDADLTAAGLQQGIDRIIADGVIDASVSTIAPLEQRRNELIAPDRARGFLTITTATLVIFLAYEA